MIDFNQFVNFKEQIQYNRQINGYEIDFDFPLFNLSKKNVMLFGEFTAIKFLKPDTIKELTTMNSQMIKNQEMVFGEYFFLVLDILKMITKLFLV